MRYSSAARNAALGLVAVALPLTGASRRPVSAMKEVRPAVTLVVRIDTGYIRDKMGDDDCSGPCEVLRASLVDTVRRVLRARYPFLRWQNEAASDTVELTWINGRGVGVLGSRLQFQFRGDSAVDTDRYAVDFESREDFSRRGDDWTPSLVRDAWLARLPTVLDSPDILAKVIGRVPLRAPIQFNRPPRRRAQIEVMPESLFARRDDPPSFELRVHVKQGTDIDQD